MGNTAERTHGVPVTERKLETRHANSHLESQHLEAKVEG